MSHTLLQKSARQDTAFVFQNTTAAKKPDQDSGTRNAQHAGMHAQHQNAATSDHRHQSAVAIHLTAASVR